MSSDGWKVIWFGVFCVVVMIVAWYATSYLSSSTTPATQRVVNP
jgi:hypothetical protein